jgi:hypothetical protein
MIRYVYFAALLSLFFACKDSKNEKVVDMEDVISIPKEEKIEKEDPIADSLSGLISLMQAEKSGIRISSLAPVVNPMFPDRFAPTKTRKLVLNPGKDSIVFCQWVFKDTVRTKNALYNWLDCFGASCKSIKVAEKKNFQRDHMLMLINDTSITYLSSPIKINRTLWLDYFDKLEVDTWRLILEQSAGGKATWNQMKKGEIEVLKWVR